jgi:chromosome segregation ATPase
MPEWWTGAAAILASIASLWAIVQNKRKVHAEADTLVIQSYKLLIGDLQHQVEELNQQVRMLREQVQCLEEQVQVLHEQKVHAESFLTILQAKLAAYEGHRLTNGEA